MNKSRKDKTTLSLDLISKYRNEIFGLSIISIIFFHFVEQIQNNFPDGAYPASEWYDRILNSVGVDCFLFLSGMGLYFSMTKNSNIRQFYSKRLKRVVIPYAVWGTVFWMIEDLLVKREGIDDFLYDFSFLSFWIEGTRVLWYIGFIIIMYLIFPLIFRFLNSERHNFIRLLVLLAICVCANETLNLFAPEVYDNIEIATGRIPIFLIGTYMGGRIYRHQPFRPADVILLIAGLAARLFEILAKCDVVSVDFDLKRYGSALFSISLIFICAWIFSKIKWKPIHKFLVSVGAVSLELYLTHVTIANLMRLLGYPTYSLRNYTICIALSIIFSIMLHFSLKKIKIKKHRNLFHIR